MDRNSYHNQIVAGDVLDCLGRLPDGCAQCCVTSPPYWGLRDYGVDGQLGLEATPAGYIEKMVAVFKEIRRVLRKDGTLWLNMGDSYTASGRGGDTGHSGLQGSTESQDESKRARQNKSASGLKPKNLMGMPWRLAFALQDDGWILRSDIVWHKPNPMPESIRDRPTKSHEYIFLMAQSVRYYYDHEAIKEPLKLTKAADGTRIFGGSNKHGANLNHGHRTTGRAYTQAPGGRNSRSVWTIAPQPFKEAHFATFPEKLVSKCVSAGTSEKGACPKCGAPWKRKLERVETGETQKMGDGWATHEGGHGSFHKSGREAGAKGRHVTTTRTVGWEPSCKCGYQVKRPCLVIDPFMGSGTVALVAHKLGRAYWGCDLNPEYVEMARRRIDNVAIENEMKG